MATKRNEIATARARLFPSTYSWLGLEGAKAKPRQTIAETVEELRKEVLKLRRAKLK